MKAQSDLGKRKIVFASDLDNCILDFDRSYFDFCNIQIGTNFCYKDIFSPNYWEVLGIKREEAIRLVHEFQETETFENLDFIAGARENILNLKSIYGKFPIITSRDIRFKYKTKNHIERILPLQVSEIYHSDQHFEINGRCKSKICEELGVNILVEDNSIHSKNCADLGVEVLLIDRPWNQGFLYNNVTRVKDWYEIFHIVNKKMEQNK